MAADSRVPGAGPVRRAGRSVHEQVASTVLTGVAVILPFVVTLYVLDVAVGFLASALDPFVKLLRWGGRIRGVRNLAVVQLLLEADIIASEGRLVTDLIALAALLAVVAGLGVVGRVSLGERLIGALDRLVVAIPELGTVYKSLRRLSDAMIESEMENLQDGRLVEVPREATCTLGARTADAPGSVRTSAAVEDMETLFLPLAPSSVMGGFLCHVPAENVRDIDTSVEDEGRSIITSGITTGPGTVGDTAASSPRTGSSSWPRRTSRR